MSIVPIMIGLSLLVLMGAGIAFFWAVDHDQFEDLKSPAFLPLLDDAEPASPDAPPAVALRAEQHDREGRDQEDEG